MTKILVVEDDEATCDIIVSVLRDAGYECAEAVDGLHGVEVARMFHPDLIVCDVQMPKLDGFGVFKELSQDPNLSTTPFIFLTGNSSAADIRKGMRIGADDYLCKPFHASDLLDSIQTRLKKKEFSQEKQQVAIEQARQEFSRAVLHDALTGLPDHKLLSEKFKEISATLAPNCGVGFIMVGIDRLRNVNEAFGPQGGDFILQETVKRIQSCLRHSDILLRGEGDTFVILVADLKTSADPEAVPKRVLEKMAPLFDYQNQELHITASIGGSVCSVEAEDYREAMNRAQMAMRSVRDHGGNGFQFYHPDMKKLALDRLTLEGFLMQARQRQELTLYYQPKASLWTNEIIGMEALIRWQHPQIGLVPPIQFIPIAEENGLIFDIGRWVLETACRTVKAWQDRGLGYFKLAVNVSGRQVERADFIPSVEAILAETGFPADCLELEVTESFLVKNRKVAEESLQVLKAKGITIAIDDFGTGYSSMNYLRQFPFDLLKLDRSFVMNLGTSEPDSEIVSTIIQMGHNLKLKVVAEGVETESQLTYLRVLSCDEYQGYLLSPPLPEKEFLEFVEAHRKKNRS